MTKQSSLASDFFAAVSQVELFRVNLRDALKWLLVSIARREGKNWGSVQPILPGGPLLRDELRLVFLEDCPFESANGNIFKITFSAWHLSDGTWGIKLVCKSAKKTTLVYKSIQTAPVELLIFLHEH